MARQFRLWMCSHTWKDLPVLTFASKRRSTGVVWLIYFYNAWRYIWRNKTSKIRHATVFANQTTSLPQICILSKIRTDSQIHRCLAVKFPRLKTFSINSRTWRRKLKKSANTQAASSLILCHLLMLPSTHDQLRWSSKWDNVHCDNNDDLYIHVNISIYINSHIKYA